MLLYRMNRVPALNYVKFLELIGIELQPAEPAQAEVTLPVQADATRRLVPVPLRTQLSADPGDGGPPLHLRDDPRASMAWRARLDAVLVRGDGDPAYLAGHGGERDARRRLRSRSATRRATAPSSPSGFVDPGRGRCRPELDLA